MTKVGVFLHKNLTFVMGSPIERHGAFIRQVLRHGSLRLISSPHEKRQPIPTEETRGIRRKARLPSKAEGAKETAMRDASLIAKYWANDYAKTHGLSHDKMEFLRSEAGGAMQRAAKSVASYRSGKLRAADAVVMCNGIFSRLAKKLEKYGNPAIPNVEGFTEQFLGSMLAVHKYRHEKSRQS